jgi:hypothetical protein
MKEEKKPKGRPKTNTTHKNESFWCNPKNKEIIKQFIKANKL